MADETRTFEELKAEQDRLWVESESKPEPEGYDAWFRAQVQEALDECAKPDAVFYAAEDVDRFMEERRKQRNAGLLEKRAS